MATSNREFLTADTYEKQRSQVQSHFHFVSPWTGQQLVNLYAGKRSTSEVATLFYYAGGNIRTCSVEFSDLPRFTEEMREQLAILRSNEPQSPDCAGDGDGGDEERGDARDDGAVTTFRNVVDATVAILRGYEPQSPDCAGGGDGGGGDEERGDDGDARDDGGDGDGGDEERGDARDDGGDGDGDGGDEERGDDGDARDDGAVTTSRNVVEATVSESPSSRAISVIERIGLPADAAEVPCAYDALLGAVESMEEAVRTAEGGEAYQALVQQVVGVMPKKELEKREEQWTTSLKNHKEIVDGKISAALLACRSDAKMLLNVLCSSSSDEDDPNTFYTMGYAVSTDDYNVSTFPKPSNTAHVTVYLASSYAYFSMTTQESSDSASEFIRTCNTLDDNNHRKVAGLYWEGFVRVIAQYYSGISNLPVDANISLKAESAGLGISSTDAPMLGGTYFTPHAFYSLKTLSRDAKMILSSIHPFIANIVKGGDCKDRFFIGFPPDTPGFDGCMVIRNGAMSFDVILVQQTIGLKKVHANDRSVSGSEFCHTAAVRFLQEYEKKEAVGDNSVTLNVLGTCYVFASENFTITGSCNYPVDKLKIDMENFRDLKKKLSSYREYGNNVKWVI
jgi:hypothetical protein